MKLPDWVIQIIKVAVPILLDGINKPSNQNPKK